MNRRHADVNNQLSASNLHAHDVRGDGNCLFRAAAYACYENEEQHVTLRAEVVSRIEQNKLLYKDLFCLNDDGLAGLLTNLRVLGRPAGEQAVQALCDVLHKNILVHTAYGAILPYKPSSGMAESSIRLAFYDGLGGGTGHYKAVMAATSTSSSSATASLN
jgi:hypothetical protein